MDLEVERRRFDVLAQAAPLILLDTNAVIWLHRGDRRAAALAGRATRLYASPATILELQFLIEAGRLRLRAGASVSQLIHDDRWVVDDPASAAWFEKAGEIGFTRDPFDRLIVAHARLRQWRLATGDRALLGQLASGERIDL
jgi:PIN domain nuclease of toxin-antitoxin system